MREIVNSDEIIYVSGGGKNKDADDRKSSGSGGPSDKNATEWACYKDIRNGAVGGAITNAYAGIPGVATGAALGAVAGAVVSDNCGKAASSRVICTYFYQKGMLERDLWQADMKFTIDFLPDRMVAGYHVWAIPYVKLMRKYKMAEFIMLPLARWRAEEIGFKVGIRERGNLKGKVIRFIGEPACYALGFILKPSDWRSLWAGSKFSA